MGIEKVYAVIGKRLLDILIASMSLILLSPLLMLLALLIRVKLGPRIFFTQKRPGKNQKIFLLYKFRTMTDERDEFGNLLPDDQRLTFFGNLLRSMSLDELPELWNILKGEMSLIGPRPLLPEYLPLYNSEQKKRHLVRPGLTGLAQINGRNATSWQERFAWDCRYVQKITFWQDCLILLATIKIVVKREGISEVDHVTKKEFEGNK